MAVTITNISPADMTYSRNPNINFTAKVTNSLTVTPDEVWLGLMIGFGSISGSPGQNALSSWPFPPSGSIVTVSPSFSLSDGLWKWYVYGVSHDGSGGNDSSDISSIRTLFIDTKAPQKSVCNATQITSNSF